MVFAQGNTTVQDATLNIPYFLMLLKIFSSSRSLASVEKFYFSNIWYTFPHLSVSPSLSRSP
jgi:hypothetical protein